MAVQILARIKGKIKKKRRSDKCATRKLGDKGIS